MKHRVVGRRLDRTTEHRTAMLRNMVTSLFRHERIVTTTPKAKELKRFADKMVTLAKRGTAHHRRIANRDVRDVEVLNKLFDTLAGRYETRPGGYTRIVRVGRRHGDNADMSVIELLDRAPTAAPEEGEEAKKATKTKEAKEAKAAAPKKAKAPKAEKAPKAAKAPKAPKAAKPAKGAKKTTAKKAKDEE
jgi:large subunit ribosomal protein L17